MSAERRKRGGALRSPAIGWTLGIAVAIGVSAAAWYPLSAPSGGHGISLPWASSTYPASGAGALGRVSPPSLNSASASAMPVPAAELASDHVTICSNSAVLDGPASPPAGAISVPAGDNSRVDWSRAGRTYWFAPGVHTLGTGQFDQIDPGKGSTYIGAPGAILDGQNRNRYAFGGYGTNATISYLTVEDFGWSGGNFDQGVINVNSVSGWTVDHSTVEDNAGAGVMLGSRDRLLYDCLSKNGQYGFNAYSAAGPSHLTLEYSEIAGNDTYNWEKRDPGCGCSGGGKFWRVDGAVVIGNWVHGNHNVGLWADTDNRGFEFEDNYFQDNYNCGLIYEISYNALIRDNLFVHNAVGYGPVNPGFPTAALYVSESGSDPRVAGSYGTTFAITGNMFVNNWNAVILWENANRFCGSPDNSSTGACTLVDPSVANIRTCSRTNLTGAVASDVPDYFDLCRWKTQNVAVTDNVFDFDPAAIGPACTVAHYCGFVGVFSEWGSNPNWSPYQGKVVEDHITFDQDNVFSANIYNGPWHFMALADGQNVSWSAWRARYHQDAGSELNRTATT